MNIKPKKLKRGCYKRVNKKKTTKELPELPINIIDGLDVNLTFEIYQQRLKLILLNIDYGVFEVVKTGAGVLDIIKVVEEKQFRGFQKYFICLGCNSKVYNLYLSSQIRCRRCLGLTYMSSQIRNTKKELNLILSSLRGAEVQRL